MTHLADLLFRVSKELAEHCEYKLAAEVDAALAALSAAPAGLRGDVATICNAWVADGRGDDCFWEGWPGQPDCENLTPNMVLAALTPAPADEVRRKALIEAADRIRRITTDNPIADAATMRAAALCEALIEKDTK
jgi:hypothetical protein